VSTYVRKQHDVAFQKTLT